MAIKTVSRVQRRMMEISLVGTGAHNLAKYTIGIAGAYTAEEFKQALVDLMHEYHVEEDVIASFITRIEQQAYNEYDFFRRHGEFASSDGGSSMTVDALFSFMLEGMGYEREVK